MRIRDGNGSRPWSGPGVPRVERSVSVSANQLLAVREPRNGAKRFAGDETRVGHFGSEVPQDDQTGLESHQQLPLAIHQVDNNEKKRTKKRNQQIDHVTSTKQLRGETSKRKLTAGRVAPTRRPVHHTMTDYGGD